MRSIHDWFASYSADHQNPTNQLIHWFCVPAILWTVIAALWQYHLLSPDTLGGGWWIDL